MPQPKPINSRKVWDRLEVDAAFSALPRDGDEANPFDSIDLYLSPADALERMRKAHGKSAGKKRETGSD